MNERASLFAFLGRKVDPTQERVFKFFPNSPPLRGEIVVVGDLRCRVARCRVRWDGPRWTIRELRVKEAPRG
jgi:hypothetical protein